jgi:hypothetical protein
MESSSCEHAGLHAQVQGEGSGTSSPSTPCSASELASLISASAAALHAMVAAEDHNLVDVNHVGAVATDVAALVAHAARVARGA